MTRELDKLDTCPDCGAGINVKHDASCDVARCLATGRQRIGCEFGSVFGGDEDHDCGRDVWTGYWPGEVDAARLGFWCRPVGAGFEPCGPDHPDAMPDLNRLTRECQWNSAEKRWELRATA